MKRLLIAIAIIAGLAVASEAVAQEAYLYRCSPAGCFPIRNAFRRAVGMPPLRRAYPVPQKVQYQPVQQPRVQQVATIPAQPIRRAAAPIVEKPKQVIKRACQGGVCRRW